MNSIHLQLTIQVMWLAVTKVRSASFGLVLYEQHIFANSVNILVTWGLPVTIFHSTYIFCVDDMALANTAVLCMHVCIVCLPVGGTPWWVLLQHSIIQCCIFAVSLNFCKEYLKIFNNIKVTHHPHTVGYLCTKFCFFSGLLAELAHGEKLLLDQSATHRAYLMPAEIITADLTIACFSSSVTATILNCKHHTKLLGGDGKFWDNPCTLDSHLTDPGWIPAVTHRIHWWQWKGYPTETAPVHQNNLTLSQGIFNVLN